MALGLDGNWRAELLRLRLARKIGEDGVKFLIEAPGESRDSTLSLANEAMKGTDLDRLYSATDNIGTRKREASNEWLLSGAHSVSAHPPPPTAPRRRATRWRCRPPHSTATAPRPRASAASGWRRTGKTS